MKDSRGRITLPGADKGIFRVPFDEGDAGIQLENYLDYTFSGLQTERMVIVCVGTDRSTGDAFGPIVGTKLLSSGTIPGVDVYGTLDEPVHAVNLSATLADIASGYRDRPFMVAIDACLGKFDHVGHIMVEEGPLRPGAGVKKTLPEFGNVTLTGVVNVSGFMEYFVLQNTRLGIVMKMTDVAVSALRASLLKVSIRRAINLPHAHEASRA